MDLNKTTHLQANLQELQKKSGAGGSCNSCDCGFWDLQGASALRIRHLQPLQVLQLKNGYVRTFSLLGSKR